MNKVSIIGFGRFGAMLHALLSKGFEVDVYDKNPIDNSEINEVSLEDALRNETIFIAVPIRDFEELIVNISDKIESGKTLIDVCSVKVFPKKVMKDNLPDIILSGVNHGMNVADDVGYSGTIGAAFEGAINNIPAIAFSQDGGDLEADFAPTKEAGEMVLRYVLDNLPARRSVLNVNFPKLSTGRVKGIMPTFTDEHKLGDILFDAQTPHHHRIGPMRIAQGVREGSDRDALQKGYVSVTPLMMGQTDKAQMARYKALNSDLDSDMSSL